MLKVRQTYRLRDLRKLRRQGNPLTYRAMQTLLSPWLHPKAPSRPADGSEWTTLPTAELSSLSDPTENTLKQSGEIPDVSTDKTDAGNLGADGPSPTQAA